MAPFLGVLNNLVTRSKTGSFYLRFAVALKMYEKQSMETNQEKRKKLVWEIDEVYQEDAARPIIYQSRLRTCH